MDWKKNPAGKRQGQYQIRFSKVMFHFHLYNILQPTLFVIFRTSKYASRHCQVEAMSLSFLCSHFVYIVKENGRH